MAANSPKNSRQQYLFVDTSTFEEEGFGFRVSNGLRMLADAVDAHAVRVVLVNVTNDEVRSRIRKRVLPALTKVKQQGYVLRGLQRVNFDALHRMSPEDAVADVVGEWERYRTRLNAVEVDVDTVPPTRVMQAHFSEQAPFSREKPDEFRDAFVIEALRDWASKEHRQVVVVSADRDFERACDGDTLVYVARLEDAIVKVSESAESLSAERDRLGHAVRNLLVSDDELEQIHDCIQVELPPLVSFARDYDGDVDFVSVTRVRPKSETFRVAEIRPDHVIVVGDVHVDFQIEVYALEGTAAKGGWTVDAEAELTIVANAPIAGVPPIPEHIGDLAIEHPKQLILSSSDLAMSKHQTFGSVGIKIVVA